MKQFGVKNIHISGLELTLLNNSHDENWYSRRDTVEEVNSRWYGVLAEMGVKTLIDVGANYGMIGAICAKAMRDINVIAIEPDPRLIPLIKKNLKQNNVARFKVIHAAATEGSTEHLTFSLNPKSTLDNRVNMPGWDQVSVPGITLDELLEDGSVEFPLYIKIDTQGFERSVFKGAVKLLESSSKWIIKTEFAPHWLESQGTDPAAFLNELLSKYSVFESPLRYLFSARGNTSGLGSALTKASSEEFVAYVKSLNSNKQGWVDLIVRPSLAS
ncbi:MAG: FkbM family methyltransferase [Flavobacterium sp.]|jgi:FkbM family methyltransferase